MFLKLVFSLSKKSSDCLVMSNLFILSEGGNLVQNLARSILSLPVVKLGDQHFQKVSTNFNNLFNLISVNFQFSHLIKLIVRYAFFGSV